jgi:hypothetical protein
MPEQVTDQNKSKERILATIANKKDPTQLVEIVHVPEKQLFLTRGISHNFQLKEIAVSQRLMLSEIHEVTEILSYILERIATASDLNLPFHYDYDFDFGGHKYRLQESDDYLMLMHSS